MGGRRVLLKDALSSTAKSITPLKITPLVVIPLYNHGDSIGEVIKKIIDTANGFTILIVDDGSTDDGLKNVTSKQQEYNSTGVPAEQQTINILSHQHNLGKGRAIISAAKWACEHNFTHIITIDADGQHDPNDLIKFISAIRSDPQAVWVGDRDFSVDNVPGASKFGRAFSAFWMQLQTGASAPDMQSGFRAYPVDVLQHLALHQRGYAFEIEVIVKAVWSGFEVKSIPITVYYPPAEKRVSHFKKLTDNIKISWLNTKLTIRALVPLPFNKHSYSPEGKISILRPLESLRMLLLQENISFVLAASTFFAIFIHMLPIPGLQSIAMLFCIAKLKLHRVWALTVSHACWPPAFIALSIEAGHYIRYGELLTNLSRQTIVDQAWQRIFEWIIGGLLFGPLFALFWAVLVYFLAVWINNKTNRRKEHA